MEETQQQVGGLATANITEQTKKRAPPTEAPNTNIAGKKTKKKPNTVVYSRLFFTVKAETLQQRLSSDPKPPGTGLSTVILDEYIQSLLQTSHQLL